MGKNDILRSIKGMRDLYEEELATWRHIERVSADVFQRYGYGEIRTPSLEVTQLFVRGVGEGTDIVEKEMYAFNDKDKKSTSLCLRPENTAGVVRALLQAGKLHTDSSERVFYQGPMFRRERPAKGRYRQFHQLGAEVFGLSAASVDIEMLSMLHTLLTELGLDDVSVKINSLGDKEDRPKFSQALKEYFEPHREALCSDCQRRLETNVLRILDCKVPADKALAENAPRTIDHLGDESRKHYEQVCEGLEALNIKSEQDPRLVRGLDYYTRTVFEAQASAGLGAQNAVAGGGRYDNLVESLGGKPVPAMGFAAGIERLFMLIEEAKKTIEVSAPQLMLVGVDDQGRTCAHRLAHELRALGLRVEVDHRGRSMKAQMKRADKSKAHSVLVIGENELQRGQAEVRELRAKKSAEVKLEANALMDHFR